MARVLPTYVALRDRLKLHGGEIHAGEAFPASEVTRALIDVGCVSGGVGAPPADVGVHCAFTTAELATLQILNPDVTIDPGVRCDRCVEVENERREKLRLEAERLAAEERDSQERGRQEQLRLQAERDRRDRQAALDELIDQKLAEKRRKA